MSLAAWITTADDISALDERRGECFAPRRGIGG